MNYDIYYVNSENVKISLVDWPYMIFDGDILEYKWDYKSVAKYGLKGSSIATFSRKTAEKKLSISIMANTEDLFYKELNKLFDVFETDVVNKKPGQLWCNGNYIECYMIEASPEEWISPTDYLDVELTFLSCYPFWIRDREYIFEKTIQRTEKSKVYPYKYPYRYPSGQTDRTIYQDHISDCDFKLVMNGPAVDPVITIAKGKESLVYGVNLTIKEHEYVEIDSWAGTVMYHKNDGTIVNIFDYRFTQNSIFKKIPRGTLKVSWTGAFPCALTIREERSIPRWNL